MIESFDDAMAFMRKAITDDCDQTYCAMYDDDCYACEGTVLDRLQRAHDHEMEQLRRLRFREGYEAGQRIMDAERYQLKLRLQRLKFGDGSHENLSRLAYAIYPCPTGWGKESCEGLRDKLIELLGGVHDEPAPIPASRCACDADCDCGHGDEAAVRITDELRKYAKTQAYPHNDRLRAIADRIDEQFNRICWQQEAVLQHTIDTMVDERDELQRELSEQKSCAEGFAPPEWYEERVLNIEKERDELKKKLDKYERRDTAESIVRDIHLGKVTDSQAVERIRALNG